MACILCKESQNDIFGWLCSQITFPQRVVLTPISGIDNTPANTGVEINSVENWSRSESAYFFESIKRVFCLDFIAGAVTGHVPGPYVSPASIVPESLTEPISFGLDPNQVLVSTTPSTIVFTSTIPFLAADSTTSRVNFLNSVVISREGDAVIDTPQYSILFAPGVVTSVTTTSLTITTSNCTFGDKLKTLKVTYWMTEPGLFFDGYPLGTHGGNVVTSTDITTGSYPNLVTGSISNPYVLNYDAGRVTSYGVTGNPPTTTTTGTVINFDPAKVTMSADGNYVTLTSATPFFDVSTTINTLNFTDNTVTSIDSATVIDANFTISVVPGVVSSINFGTNTIVLNQVNVTFINTTTVNPNGGVIVYSTNSNVFIPLVTDSIFTHGPNPEVAGRGVVRGMFIDDNIQSDPRVYVSGAFDAGSPIVLQQPGDKLTLTIGVNLIPIAVPQI